MSDIPPVGPPIVFRYDSRALWLSSVWTIVCLVIAVINLVMLVMSLVLHRPWILNIFIAFFTGLFGFAGILRLMITLGATIEVVGDRLIWRDRKRKLIRNISFSEITGLKAVVRSDEDKPNSYSIETGTRGFYPIFSELIEIDRIIGIIETRTGKQFEYKSKR